MPLPLPLPPDPEPDPELSLDVGRELARLLEKGEPRADRVAGAVEHGEEAVAHDRVHAAARIRHRRSRARIPAVPMLSPEELVEHPQMAARSAFPEIEHPARGRVRVTALPFHIDHRPVAPAGPAPYRVGEQTREVLTGFLGYSDERVKLLQSQRVVEIPG